MAKKKNSRRSRKRSLLKTTNTLRNRRLLYILVITLIVSFGIYSLRSEDLGPQLPPPPANALYKLADQPIEARVQDLLSRMTLEEKIGQMSLVDKNSLGKVEDISRYSLGGVLSGAGAKPKINTPEGWREMVENMKHQAMNSRLQIPILYGVDANHGHANVPGATVFPHAIGLGASGDSELVESVASATSQELRATGINWNFSPSLDAPKDIRWGRVYEAFSDNPELNATLGKAYIDGTQSSADNTTHLLASAKHFVATGAMEWGQSNHKEFSIDQGKTPIDDVALKQEYLLPYQSAVEADVASVMIGLNQWGEERIIDSKYLITDKLKNELGFKGFVVSDWYGVYEYAHTHKYTANVNTINAGLDMAMLPYDYKDFLKDVRKAVQNGEIQQKRINDAVRRILYQKFRAGLFDSTSGNIGLETVGSKEHRRLARKAVASSAVLLKNSDELLPIDKNVGEIYVAGSGADNVGRQSGAWTVEWQGIDGNWLPGSTSILEGIRQAVGNGSNISFRADGNFGSDKKKAKIGIVVVSEKPYAEGWGDNPHPTIEPADLETIANLKQSSEKIVVVILSGRPLIITNQITSWDAVVAAWLPGSEGAGIADVLFGDRPFSGTLPITWPADIRQVPIKADGDTKNGTKPLFERGFRF